MAERPIRADGPDPDVLQFFDGHGAALPLFLRLLEMLALAFPDANMRVQKTQITFFCRRAFACVSFARVKRKADLPPGYMVVTFSHPGPLGSCRAACSAQVRPGRWTHHVVVSSPEELDGELLEWIRESRTRFDG